MFGLFSGKKKFWTEKNNEAWVVPVENNFPYFSKKLFETICPKKVILNDKIMARLDGIPWF